MQIGNQMYTWWYFISDKIQRFDQLIGKKYCYDHGSEGKNLEETLKIQNTLLEKQIKLEKVQRDGKVAVK